MSMQYPLWLTSGLLFTSTTPSFSMLEDAELKSCTLSSVLRCASLF